MQNNFELFEPIVALRGVLLNILGTKEYVPQHLLTVMKLARKAFRFQVASNALYQLKQDVQAVKDPRWKLEEAKVDHLIYAVSNKSTGYRFFGPKGSKKKRLPSQDHSSSTWMIKVIKV